MDPYSSSSSVAVTYQFVIVAVVATAIFAAGVVTVMYRRRRAQLVMMGSNTGDYTRGYGFGERYDWRGPPPPPRARDTRLVMDERGVFVEVPVPPKKKVELGPEPVVWDVVIRGTEKEMGKEKGVDKGVEKVVGEKEVDEKEGLDTLDGLDTWAPTSLTLPTARNPFAPPHINTTVLVAMPDPSLTFDERNPAAYNPPAKPATFNEYGDEDIDVPNIQLGVATLAVDNSTWDEVEALRPPPRTPAQPARSRSRGVRRVRVDGFSRSLLRL